MTVKELDVALMKPLYVHRMARAMINHPDPKMRKSAQTRMKNAEKKVQDVIAKYAADLVVS